MSLIHLIQLRRKVVLLGRFGIMITGKQSWIIDDHKMDSAVTPKLKADTLPRVQIITRNFGNLIRNGYFETDTQIGNDDFEEYESILKDLSDREIIYLIVFANYARKNDGKLCGKQLKEECQEMQKIYPKINPKIILNRLKRTGFIEDLFAWADFGDERIDNSDATLMLNNGDSYWLNESYDDFEQKVLNSYDSGRRV